jgi:predicted site-specific integrase-resolvase
VKQKKNRYARPGKGVLLTRVELAATLGESSRTITNWERKGLISPVKLGHRTHRYIAADVLAALGKRTVKGSRR